jgi:hypothetical protein
MKTNRLHKLGTGLFLVLLTLSACTRTVTPPAAEVQTLASCTATDETSLREHIGLESRCDFITVANDITLIYGELVLDKNLTIAGPEGGNVTIDGNSISRVFYVAAGTAVTLRNLTITGGRAPTRHGGGIFSEAATLTLEHVTLSGNHARDGGGILSRGTLTIRNSTISENEAESGGGFYSQGSTATIVNSTIAGNRGYPERSLGGGIFNDYGSVTLENSSVARNTSAWGGGGILNSSTGTLTITNSTIAANDVIFPHPSFSYGGGISSGGTLTIENSIVAANRALNNPNVSGTFTGSHNLIGGNPGLELADDGRPRLADNGGPTKTIALRADSPAIDAADIGDCTATDQRGVSRPQGTGCDIGAYEYGYPVFTGFFSPVNDDPTLNTAKAGQTIPLKWHLEDVFGNPITDLASVAVSVTHLDCTAGSTADAVEEYARGTSGLQNIGDGHYQFNWATPKNYAGSCKTMRLDLGDGITQTALFQFTK